jgi:hypothetical protein
MKNAATRITIDIRNQGFAIARSSDFDLSELKAEWTRLASDWNNLVVDKYMADAGRYRLRRFGRFYFVPATETLIQLAHAPVFQTKYVNNFAGGIQRDFAPLTEETFANSCLLALIKHDFKYFEVSDASRLSEPWEVWVHQIRIQTDGPNLVTPAPEGIHHDGHDFIAMHLVNRENVSGGENIIYDNAWQPLASCMLEHPLDTIYCDDHRVMHAVEPISAADEVGDAKRDILIIDFDYKPQLVSPQ